MLIVNWIFLNQSVNLCPVLCNGIIDTFAENKILIFLLSEKNFPTLVIYKRIEQAFFQTDVLKVITLWCLQMLWKKCGCLGHTFKKSGSVIKIVQW